MKKPFDKEAAHDTRIKPLMTALIAICREEGIPALAVFNYAKRGEEDFYSTTCAGVSAEELPPEFVHAVQIIRGGSPLRRMDGAPGGMRRLRGALTTSPRTGEGARPEDRDCRADGAARHPYQGGGAASLP